MGVERRIPGMSMDMHMHKRWMDGVLAFKDKVIDTQEWNGGRV